MKATKIVEKLRVGRGIPIGQIASALDMHIDTYEKLENKKRDLTIEDVKKLAEFYMLDIDLFVYDNSFDDQLELYYKAFQVMKYARERISSNKRFFDVLPYLLYCIDMAYFHIYSKQIMGLVYTVHDVHDPAEKIIKFKWYCEEDYENFENMDTSDVTLYKDEVEVIDNILDFFKGKTIQEIEDFIKKDIPVLTKFTPEDKLADSRDIIVDYGSVFYRVPVNDDDNDFGAYKIFNVN